MYWYNNTIWLSNTLYNLLIYWYNRNKCSLNIPIFSGVCINYTKQLRWSMGTDDHLLSDYYHRVMLLRSVVTSRRGGIHTNYHQGNSMLPSKGHRPCMTECILNYSSYYLHVLISALLYDYMMNTHTKHCTLSYWVNHLIISQRSI